MDIFVKGKGQVKLSDREIVGSGGQGTVWAKSKIAYKIYSDPSKMIPLGKIQELAKLTDPNIIKPEDVIIDKKNNPIGYTMRFVKDPIAIVQLFTKSFKKRNNITLQKCFELIKKLQKIIHHCHKNNVLMVDINEMNFLVNSVFSEIYCIDVDSYQTPSYPATAIMMAYKDFHSNTFNDLTDWFSFGVVSFYLATGTHPYFGSHPKYGDNDIEQRMKDNVSVFNRKVSLPPVVLPFDQLPLNYKNWYEDLFENGKRSYPPDMSDFIATTVMKPQMKVLSNGDFIVSEIASFNGDIIFADYIDNRQVVLTSSGLYVDGKFDNNIKDGVFSLSPKMNYVICSKIDNGKISMLNFHTGKNVSINASAEKLMSYGGRLYCKNDESFYEVEMIEAGMNILGVMKKVCNVLPNGTRVLDGVVIQNLLNSYYVSIFPKTKVHYQIKIDELKGHRIVDAKFNNNVLIVVGEKAGKFDRFVIRFSEDYSSYDCRIVNNIKNNEINFAVKDNGICILLNEDNKLELFFNQKGSTGLKIIEHDRVFDDASIICKGSKTLFYKDDTLYEAEIKKP